MSSNSPELPMPDAGEDGLYTLVGTAIAKPGMADHLEARLVSMVEPTRKEPGVLAYHVHRDRADVNRFVFYEAWRSLEDLRRHFDAPYVAAFLEDRHRYLEGDLEITWLRMVSKPAF